MKIKTGAQDVITQDVGLLAMLDGFPDAPYGQGILGTDIEKSMVCTYGIGTDNHPLDHPVWVRFKEHPVHEGTGVTLITIAYHIFLLALVPCHQFPLHAGRETCASPSPDSAFAYFVDDLFRSHFLQGPLYGYETTPRTVFLNIDRIQDTPVFGGNRNLFPQKGNHGFLTHIQLIAFHPFPFCIGLYVFCRFKQLVFQPRK